MSYKYRQDIVLYCACGRVALLEYDLGFESVGHNTKAYIDGCKFTCPECLETGAKK